MSSSKLNIYNAVLATLNTAKAPGGQLAFVNNIYNNGFTTVGQIPPNACPAIEVEPFSDSEEWFTAGVAPALLSKFKVFVECILYESSPGAGVIGDASQTPPVIGILEFMDRVKQVLQADMTLGGGLGMQKVSFPEAPIYYVQYPMRQAKITVLLESQLATNAHI